MESWGIGFDGDIDVERHAGMHDARPAGEAASTAAKPRLRLRVVSDYI
jgi:hypothetical protein